MIRAEVHIVTSFRVQPGEGEEVEYQLRCWVQSTPRYLLARAYEAWVSLSDPLVRPLSRILSRRHRAQHGKECMCIPWDVRRDLVAYELNSHGAPEAWLPIDAETARNLGWGQ